MELNGVDLIELVLATGALGTASFGLVENLKGLWVGQLGFGQITKSLGPLSRALEVAYGPNYLKLLKGQYRNGRAKGDLPKTLRQGVRVGVNEDNADQVACYVGVVSARELEAAISSMRAIDINRESEAEEGRRVIGRFELAVDARLNAALALAEQRYVFFARLHASVIALVLAMVTAMALDGDSDTYIRALLVGIAAIPIAPVAKDISAVLRHAKRAVRTSL